MTRKRTDSSTAARSPAATAKPSPGKSRPGKRPKKTSPKSTAKAPAKRSAARKAVRGTAAEPAPVPGGPLEALLPDLRAIPAAKARRPSQPVNSFVQEALNLATWARGDRTALVKGGLNWSYFESLPDRAAALSEAEALWMARFVGQRDAEKKWKEAEPVAHELRADLLAALRHAFRKRPDLLRAVTGITKGSGNADMIQDLNDIAVLGRTNFTLLKAIGITRKELDRAAKLSADLAPLLATRKSDAAGRKVKLLRNRAFVYLKEAVDEIRACGSFAFRKNPERRRGYFSEYERTRRTRRKTAGRKKKQGARS